MPTIRKTPSDLHKGAWYTGSIMGGDADPGTERKARQAAGFRTVAEVARQLRVSNMTVYRLVRAGDLPAVRVGRGYRIREKDLLDYLQTRYMDAG